MDPKALNNLDPKLKETYDRVMGTTAPSTTGAPTTTPTATPTATQVPSANLNGQSPPPVTPENTPPTPEAMPAVPSYTADNLKFQAAIQTPMVGTMPTVGLAPKPQGPSSLLKTLYIIGAIVFFVVYAYFWAKIFNLPLPF